MKELKYGILAVLSFAGFLFLLYYLKAALLPVHTQVKKVDTAYEVVDKTMTGDNAIYNYEWFKSQYEAIEAQRDKIQLAEEDYQAYKETLDKDSSKWTRFQQQEEASLRNSLSANKKILTDLIAEYNAKASMANRAIFKDNLPMNVFE